MTWKKFVLGEIRALCEAQGSRSFTLGELWTRLEPQLATRFPLNHHPAEKVRQILQQLRDGRRLSFGKTPGIYTLSLLELLAHETDEPVLTASAKLPLEKREYLIEVYARNRGWVKRIRELHGPFCVCLGCKNTFLKDDGQPYCEVHHIVPLCENGEETLENGAVLCAHHHRAAHFATVAERTKLRDFLLDFTQAKLKNFSSTENVGKK